MTRKSVIKKIIAIYFFLVGGFCFILFLDKLRLMGFLESLWPALITLIWYLLIIIGCVNYLVRPQSRLNDKFLSISLATQAIQFSLWGIYFKNYIGPYLSVGISFDPEFEFLFEYHLISFRNINGYFKGDSSMVLLINIIPIALLILIGYLEKRDIKNNECNALTFEESTNDRN